MSARATPKDRWAEWLLHRRDAGDPEVLRGRLPTLARYRERVLDNASVRTGDTLLDVGTGNGLVAFGALERVGDAGRVIFSDVSEDLLAECRRTAADLGVLDNCGFVRASADALDLITDASIDVVTTRSVLIYLDDKRPAFREFFRVLRPGGRISLFEPINRFGHPRPAHIFFGYDASPVLDLASRVRDVYETALPREKHPLLNFDERDLVRFADEAGFRPIHLEYSAEISTTPGSVRSWDTFKRMSGNPLEPTLEEAMERGLTPAERRTFEAYFKPLVEGGAAAIERSAVAYLWGAKPG